MNPAGNGSPARFNVSMSGLVRLSIDALHNRMVARGKGTEFLRALRDVFEQLRHDPWEFGEPRYQLQKLKLFVRQGIVAPVVVEYGVHQDLPLVFIRSVKVLFDD